MLAACHLGVRIWISSHLHFRTPSSNFNTLLVKTVDFKRDELMVSCDLSGTENYGHLHCVSWVQNVPWEVHHQVCGAGEQAVQAGRKHKVKQKCHNPHFTHGGQEDTEQAHAKEGVEKANLTSLSALFVMKRVWQAGAIPAWWMKQAPKSSLVAEKWTAGTTTVARSTQVNVGPWLIWRGNETA